MKTYRVTFYDYADGLRSRPKLVVVGEYEGKNALEAIRAMFADRIPESLREGSIERVVGRKRICLGGITFEANLVRREAA